MAYRISHLLLATGVILTFAILSPAPDASARAARSPAIVYATYNGQGAGETQGAAVQVDGAGDAYVLETTGASSSHSAIVVAKFAPSGQRLFSTTVSGACGGQAGGLALDRAGNVYVTGKYLSKDTYGICDLTQVLAAKLTAAGTPVYAVRFGHPDTFTTDAGNAIAVDAQGNAYVTGETSNDDAFPATPGAFQTKPTVDSAFVLKVDTTGKLVYGTFLNGGDTSKGLAIAVDRQRQAYVTGTTTSTNFPTTRNAFQTAGRRSSTNLTLGTGFVSKLNAAGSALVYSTYLGGEGSDTPTAIAVDAAGHAYVTGATASVHFPTTPTAYSRALNLRVGGCGGGLCAPLSDAFVAELNPDPRLAAPRTLVYATYFGGEANDGGGGIAVDAAHHVWLTGATESFFHFPLVAATQPRPGAGTNYLSATEDAFVAEFDLTRPGRAGLLFSTFLGGSGNDAGNGVALDRAGAAYVAGTTASPDFPTHAATQGRLSGGSDAFLVKVGTGGR